MTYSGRCVGGPHNGRMLRHTTTEYNVVFLDFERMALDVMVDEPIDDTMSYAHYDWVEGVWIWRQPI